MKTFKTFIIEEKQTLRSLQKINTDRHGELDDLSNKLHKVTASKLNVSDRANLKHYTKGDDDKEESYCTAMNKSLNQGEPLHGRDILVHDTIMKNAKSSGEELHLFSGVHQDFKKLATKTHGNTFFMPAHTSMTHSGKIASYFSEDKSNKYTTDNRRIHNIMHVHIKPIDKLLHISKFSAMPWEHETILPAKTHLKYHGTDTYKPINIHGQGVMNIHHFTVHSQE